MAEAEQTNLTLLTVDLLSAYVSNNMVQHDDLAGLIQSTHAALKTINAPEPELSAEPAFKPAVPIRKSLSSKEHIISLIDGKPYQTLKRHLTKHGLTPDQYRERFGLSKNYPMVAPAYSEQRRAIAEKLGLGRQVKGAQAPAKPEAGIPPAVKPTRAPRAKEKTVVAALPEITTGLAPTKKANATRTGKTATTPDNGAKPARGKRSKTAARIDAPSA